MDDTGHLDESVEFDPKDIESIRAFMRNAPWMPFEEYKAKIYEWNPSREHVQHNIQTDFFGAQSRANQLLREAAWMMAIERRPTAFVGNDWTLDEQRELEEELYNKFMFAAFESRDQDTPWPSDEA